MRGPWRETEVMRAAEGADLAGAHVVASAEWPCTSHQAFESYRNLLARPDRVAPVVIVRNARDVRYITLVKETAR